MSEINLKKSLLDKLSDFVTKHKAAFEAAPAALPSEAPKEYQLKDGSKVNIDKLEVGGIVTLPDGTPYANGECYLADGSTITITDGGVIGGIESAPVEGAEPAIEDMKKQCMDLNAKVGEMLSQFQSVLTGEKHDFSAQENKVKTLEAKVESQGQIIKEMFEVLSQFSNQKPIEKPIDKISPKSDKMSDFINKQLKSKN